MDFFGIGFLELVFIMLVALLVLGPSKMVEVARTLGKYFREIQRARSEVPRLFSLDDELPKAPPPQGRQLPQQPMEERPQKPTEEQEDPGSGT